MFNLQQLETLVLCVECGSFSAAARKLGKAQSAVSTTIANLEIDLGITMFDRSSRLPTLTSQGERVYHHAQHLLSQAHSLNSMVQAFQLGVEERIIIAVNPLLQTNALFSTIARFYERFPHTQLQLDIVDNEHIAEWVATRKADLGLMLWADLPSAHVSVGAIGHLSFSLAVSSNHPLANQTMVSLSQLEAYRQVMFSGFHSQFNVQLSCHVVTSNQLSTVIELLRLGDGWALLPDHIIKAHPELCMVPMCGEEQQWLLNIDRVTGKDQQLGPALTWLYQQSQHFYSQATSRC